MDPVTVNSSAISSLQFNDREESVTITFKNGTTKTVPCDRQTYDAFVSAPSVGKFYNERFRSA